MPVPAVYLGSSTTRTAPYHAAMVTRKPKMTKSVHFAPDVKYVCRERRARPSRRDGGRTGAADRLPVTDAEQMPISAEKYTIRLLPVISGGPPRPGSATASVVVYVDGVERAYGGRSVCRLFARDAKQTRLFQEPPGLGESPRPSRRPLTEGHRPSDDRLGDNASLPGRRRDRTPPTPDPATGRIRDHDSSVTSLPQINEDAAGGSPSAHGHVNVGDHVTCTEQEVRALTHRKPSLPSIGAAANQTAGRQADDWPKMTSQR